MMARINSPYRLFRRGGINITPYIMLFCKYLFKTVIQESINSLRLEQGCCTLVIARFCLYISIDPWHSDIDQISATIEFIMQIVIRIYMYLQAFTYPYRNFNNGFITAVEDMAFHRKPYHAIANLRPNFILTLSLKVVWDYTPMWFVFWEA